MAIFSTEKNLWMYKGDTGNIIFSGLPKDKPYEVYFSIYNEDGERIVKELLADLFNQSEGTALFIIKTSFSDLLPVGEFTYALKICYDGSEDTVIPETKLIDGNYVQMGAPSFTVYPKHVEGDL